MKRAGKGLSIRRNSVMKFDEGKVLLMLTGILSGIVLSVFIVNTSTKPTVILTYQQYQKYNIEANELRSELKGLYKDMNDLDKKLKKYNSSSEKNKSVMDTLKKELHDVRLFYGSSKVEGPGLRITVDDRHDYIDNEEIMDYITHNSDLLRVVNELKNAGAEAISINGKRFFNKTAITCEGPVIMVNGEFIVPPFEILAIGDPEALQYSLSLPESHIAEMKSRGLFLKIEKKDSITIDGINHTNIIRYMKQSK